VFAKKTESSVLKYTFFIMTLPALINGFHQITTFITHHGVFVSTAYSSLQSDPPQNFESICSHKIEKHQQQKPKKNTQNAHEGNLYVF
jgi:hypothetical protein